MNKIISVFAILVVLVFPVVTAAQPGELTIPISDVILSLLLIVQNILWMIAVTFTIVMFVLAGFQYLTAKGDPSKIQDANKSIIWGSAGATVIVLAWSVISVVRVQIGV